MNKYDTAKYDMLKAINSFSKLDDSEKQKLLIELIGIEKLKEIINLMNLHPNKF